MDIVNLFHDLARTHKQVRGFVYSKAYNKGTGTDAYPLVWLDDPIAGSSAGVNDNAMRYTVNVDILGIPDETTDALAIQTSAHLVGLSFREKLRDRYKGASVEGYNFITLRDYYDDNAAGVRFTYTVVLANPINLCVEYFDPSKELIVPSDLPDFSVDNPEGCAIFNDKNGLPNFKV